MTEQQAPPPPAEPRAARHAAGGADGQVLASPYVQIVEVNATPLDAAEALERPDAYGRVPVVVRIQRQPPIRFELILIAIGLAASGLFLPLVAGPAGGDHRRRDRVPHRRDHLAPVPPRPARLRRPRRQGRACLGRARSGHPSRPPERRPHPPRHHPRARVRRPGERGPLVGRDRGDRRPAAHAGDHRPAQARLHDHVERPRPARPRVHPGGGPDPDPRDRGARRARPGPRRGRPAARDHRRQADPLRHRGPRRRLHPGGAARRADGIGRGPAAGGGPADRGGAELRPRAAPDQRSRLAPVAGGRGPALGDRARGRGRGGPAGRGSRSGSPPARARRRYDLETSRLRVAQQLAGNSRAVVSVGGGQLLADLLVAREAAAVPTGDEPVAPARLRLAIAGARTRAPRADSARPRSGAPRRSPRRERAAAP